MRQLGKLCLVGLFFLFFVILGVGERSAGAYSGGPDPGNTGAPGEFTCAGCHSGPQGSGIFKIEGVPSSYTPAQEYDVTITLTQSGQRRFGFQATVLGSTGASSGTLLVTDSLRTQLRNSSVSGNNRDYIEHTISGINPTGNATGSWSFKWRAPETNVGNVTFYAAGNAANGDFSNGGDSIYTIMASSAGPPQIPTLTTVSAASFAAGAMSPNAIGAAFAPNGVLAAPGDLGVAGTVPLPTELTGSRVTVIDSAAVQRNAGLFFVSPGQINFEIPGGTASGMATVKVVRNNQTVAQGTVQIDSVSPGIFRAFPSAQDNTLAAAQIFRIKADGSSGIEDLVRFDSTSGLNVPIPIEFGPVPETIFLVLYGTGIRLRSSLSAVKGTIGGLDATVGYAGEAPGYVGLDQVNLSLSRQLITRGNVAVSLVVDGVPSNSVFINVK
jgi:uncharacterized protein (TIGR03437 family)